MEADGNIIRDWDARTYLDFYYGRHQTVPADEQRMFEFVAGALAKMGTRFPAGLEIGCGPVLHRAAQVVPWVDRLYMADYHESNLDEIRAWLRGEPDAFDWSVYLDGKGGVLDHDPAPRSTLAEREALMRKRIHAFKCDLRDPVPLGAPAEFGLVTCFYCAELVIPTREGWRQTMQYLTSTVARRGWLIMMGLHDTSQTFINNRWIPNARITQDDIRAVLIENGFDASTIEIDVTPGLNPEASGIQGTFMSYAQRHA